MTNTANLGMPFIDGSQAQKHVTHNDALRILDAAVQIGVLTTTLTAPPSTPSAGDRHVVATGATGAWAGQAKNIATWEDGAWRFMTPKIGWFLWSAGDDGIFVYDGTAWRSLRDLTMALDNAAHIGINATASSPNLLTVRSNAALFNAIAVASGGTGDARIQISKESSAKTASVVFSDAFSGRAEFGLVGSDAFKLKVSNDGSTFVEALSVDQTSGNATLPRGLALCGVISPAQITSNQNDYSPTGLSSASVVQVYSDAARNVTGLATGAEGRLITLLNTGSQTLTLNDENASSTAANRFTLGGDVTLGAKQGIVLRYDGTATRWYALARSGGSSAGALLASNNLSDLASVATARSNLAVREKLTANRTYYVATTGNDSNTGLATATTSAITFTNGSANIGWSAHGRSVGDVFVPTTSGALPTNFTAGQPLYVKTIVDTNTITVSATSGGSAISAGSAGSGTHTATLISPLLTIQKAYDSILKIDLGGYGATIFAAGGTYTGGLSCSAPPIGGNVTLTGAGSSLTIMSTTSADAVTVRCAMCLTVSNIKIQTTTTGHAIYVNGAGAQLSVGTGVELGATGYSKLRIAFGGYVQIYNNFTMSGNSLRWADVLAAQLEIANSTITVSGTPAWSGEGIYFDSASVVSIYSTTFSGSSTGKRYTGVMNAILQSFSQGTSSTYFPGNSNGTTATGAQQV